jgi:hypothetical protein
VRSKRPSLAAKHSIRVRLQAALFNRDVLTASGFVSWLVLDGCRTTARPQPHADHGSDERNGEKDRRGECQIEASVTERGAIAAKVQNSEDSQGEATYRQQKAEPRPESVETTGECDVGNGIRNHVTQGDVMAALWRFQSLVAQSPLVTDLEMQLSVVEALINRVFVGVVEIEETADA